jgi:hypothetical protein
MSLAWNISGAVSSGSAPSTPVPFGTIPSGTLGAGGGFVGLGGKQLGIVALFSSNQGSTFCGGCVGKDGRKMCISVDCDVEAHKFKKANMASVPGDQLFIMTTADPDSSKKVVHLEPSLEARALGATLKRYLVEKRSLDAWDVLFRGIQATAEQDAGVEIDEVDIRNFTERVDKRGEQDRSGVTPKKKRPKLDISSPALESNFDLTMTPLETNLGETDQEVLNALPREWKSMVSNLETLAEMVDGCRTTNKDLIEATSSEFQEVDFEIARISNLIGHRTADMDPVPIFRALGDLSKDVEELMSQMAVGGVNKLPPSLVLEDVERAARSARLLGESGVKPGDLIRAVEGFKNFKSSNGLGTVLQRDMGVEVMSAIQPLIGFFAMWSSDKSKAGDILVHELSKLKTEIAGLKAAGVASAAPVAAASTSGLGSWGLGGMSLGGGGAAAESGSSLTLMSRMTDLEDRVREIEEQLQAKSVFMGGINFKSLVTTRAWMLVNAAASGGFIYFLDAHGMLSLSTDEVGSARSVIHFQQAAKKGGFKSTEEALVVSSFKIELPSIFGSDSSSSQMTADTRTLPAMKSADVWDPKDGYTGGRMRFEALIKEAKTMMLASVGDHLQGIGKIVAMECITESYQFLMKLAEWISKEHTNLVGRGGSDEGCWKLISHCIRSIFRDLHVARLAGRGPFLGTDRAGGIVWGCLQAHRVMKEYVEYDFSAHPKCSHILNIHLQDNALMKSEASKTTKAQNALIEKLTKAVTDLQSKHDSLVGRFDKLKK